MSEAPRPGADGTEAAAVSTRDLVKHYDGGLVRAVDGVSLDVGRGEVVALMGPSGCGKTTLLNLIGSLERPDRGEVLIGGRPLDEHRPLHRFRARALGFVFQFHHLLPALTLLENVEAATYPLGLSRRVARERSIELLHELGLADRMHARPGQLSGGERQRGAVARALVNDPDLILADEPTGNLDSAGGRQMVALLLARCRARSATVLIATHNLEVAEVADRMLFMRDGRLERTARSGR
jgi:putative ABC transport system ATP-binding protein